VWVVVCGLWVAGVGNGRRRVLVRDLLIAGVPTVLVWAKRTFRCRETLCGRGSWSERSELITPRASLTERARAEICRRVGKDPDTIAEVARDLGVGWQCAHQAVIDHGDRLIEADGRVARTVGLGVDEHPFQHANARRRTQMTTIDAFRGYATAIDDVVPTATLVIDHFRTIRLASKCVDDMRRRVQQDTLGRKGDPLYGIRRLLLRAWAHLNERGRQRLRAGLTAGDPDGEVAGVWLARELLVEVYSAVDLAHAKRRLVVIFQHAADAEIGELKPDFYDVSPEGVVGSQVDYGFTRDDGRPRLLRTNHVVYGGPNEGVAKMPNIHRVLGRRSVVAGGNSAGDAEMLEYARTYDGPSPAILVNHNDAQREYAHESKAGTFETEEIILQTAERLGWVVASVRDDWATVFPDN
jgi:hypothetical protein